MSEKQPLIGVTASVNPENGGPCTSQAYLTALSDSGALPLILPHTLTKTDCRRLAGKLDGFLFTGGPDVHPFYFGEDTLEGCGSHSPQRDRTELQLFSEIFARKKPIFGICRGIQLINIALGGDIWQDIGRQTERGLPIAHSQPFSPSVPSHHVALKKDSLLSSVTGSERIEVNSSHHQAVRRPAKCLTICAQAQDEIIEGLEHPGYPFLLGVQWHPELLYHSHSHAERLFSAFVNACRR